MQLIHLGILFNFVLKCFKWAVGFIKFSVKSFLFIPLFITQFTLIITVKEMESCNTAQMTDDANIYAKMERCILEKLTKVFNEKIKSFFQKDFDERLDAIVEARMGEMLNQSSQSISAHDKTLPKNDHEARILALEKDSNIMWKNACQLWKNH